MISSHGCKLTRVCLTDSDDTGRCFRLRSCVRELVWVGAGASGVHIRSCTWRQSEARAGNGLNWIWVWSSYLKNNHIRGVMRRNIPPPSWQLVTHLERFITHILISSPFKWETESVTVSIGRIIRWMILQFIQKLVASCCQAVNWFRKLRYKSVIFMHRVWFFKLLFK